MQRSCQTCHRPGTNAPMSLLTYEDVRPWARAIKNKVTQRLMPPWHIERNVGIQQFKDDPSLSDAEIATIASWVDGGAPKGSAADMPAAPTFPDDEAWHIGDAGSDRRDSQAARRSRRRRRSVDRLHRGFRHDRGSLSAGGRGEAGPRRARRRASPADLLDPGHRSGRSARRPPRRSSDQQRELPQRVRRRQERRHSAGRHGEAGEGRIEDPLQPALSPVRQGDRRIARASD